MRSRSQWLPCAVLLLASSACFGGEGTLGGACERDGDCGAEQLCERQICSLCGDGVAQAGELCFDGPQASEAEPVGAASLAVVDVDGDGVPDVVWPVAGGLAVASGSADGFAAAQERPFDVTAVWSGDIDSDGVAELLTRDSSGGAALWRPDPAGELREVADLDLEPLRGLTDAVLHPDFGIVGEVASTLVRVGGAGEPAPVQLDGEITHLRATPSLRDGGTFDVLAVTEGRAFIPVFATEDGLEAQSAITIPEPMLDVATTRWNGDALGDAVVLYETGQVQVWLGTGGGAFAEGPGGGASLSSERIAVFDANADRLEDVVAYGPESSVYLLVRRGSELDSRVDFTDAAVSWMLPATVGSDPFTDVLLYDGTTISILRSAP